MSNYIPSLEEIKNGFVSNCSEFTYSDTPADMQDYADQFDRWLEQHDNEVRGAMLANLDKWINASIDARKDDPVAVPPTKAGSIGKLYNTGFGIGKDNEW